MGWFDSCGGVAADLEAGISSMVSNSLTHCFAFAVPCGGAVDAIAGLGCGVVEMGAGTGYWAGP